MRNGTRFATLDDSTVDKDGLFVYTHALVLNGDNDSPTVQVFFGHGKRKYKKKEEQLIGFVRDNLPEDYDLFACDHYKMYKRFWQRLVKHAANVNGVDRVVSRHFRRFAHGAAKASSRAYHQLIYDRITGINGFPHEGSFVAYAEPPIGNGENRIVVTGLEDILVHPSN